jgi:hypothetical protein
VIGGGHQFNGRMNRNPQGYRREPSSIAWRSLRTVAVKAALLERRRPRAAPEVPLTLLASPPFPLTSSSGSFVDPSTVRAPGNGLDRPAGFPECASVLSMAGFTPQTPDRRKRSSPALLNRQREPTRPSGASRPESMSRYMVWRETRKNAAASISVNQSLSTATVNRMILK